MFLTIQSTRNARFSSILNREAERKAATPKCGLTKEKAKQVAEEILTDGFNEDIAIPSNKATYGDVLLKIDKATRIFWIPGTRRQIQNKSLEKKLGRDSKTLIQEFIGSGLLIQYHYRDAWQAALEGFSWNYLALSLVAKELIKLLKRQASTKQSH
jgi:hypothetical protein